MLVLVDGVKLAGLELRVVVVTLTRIVEEGFFSGFHTNCHTKGPIFKALNLLIDNEDDERRRILLFSSRGEERSFDPRDFIRDVMHVRIQ